MEFMLIKVGFVHSLNAESECDANSSVDVATGGGACVGDKTDASPVAGTRGTLQPVISGAVLVLDFRITGLVVGVLRALTSDRVGG